MKIEGLELDQISFYDSAVFAIRCARRVQPLFELGGNREVSRKCIILQEEALSLAEEVIRLTPGLDNYLFSGLESYIGALRDACSLSAGSEASNATATSILRSVQSVIDWMSDNPTDDSAYAIHASIVAGLAVDDSFFEIVQQDFVRFRRYLAAIDSPGAHSVVDWDSLWLGTSPAWFKMSQLLQQEVLQDDTRSEVHNESVSPAMIEIIWDPEIISSDEYAEIVKALGDVARSQGAVGVERVRSTSCGVPMSEGALL